MAVPGKKGPRPSAAKAKSKPKVPKKHPAKKTTEEPVKRPRQGRLPGTEDAKIDILEDLAEDYAAIRDQRQGLSRREVDLKKKLLDLMKANKKKVYQRNGVSIKIEVEKEKVIVRVKNVDGDDEFDATEADITSKEEAQGPVDTEEGDDTE